MDHGRGYRKSHPWITFEFRIEQDRLWCLLGEAASKCQHLAGTPLQPAYDPIVDLLSAWTREHGSVRRAHPVQRQA